MVMYLSGFKTTTWLSMMALLWCSSQFTQCQNKPNFNQQEPISIASIQMVDSQLVEFLGKDNIENILNVDSLYAYELDYVEEWDTIPTNQAVLVNKYPIITQKIVSNTFIIDELKYLLLSKSNYPLDDISKKCLFTPEWGLTFFHQQDTTHLLVSERCQEWKFYHQKNTQREDIDASINRIKTLRQRIFLEEKPQ